MQTSPSELDFDASQSQSQFTQTQPATQQYSQSASQPTRFQPNLWGVLVPYGASSSTSSFGASGASTAPRLDLSYDKRTYRIGRNPKTCDLVLNSVKVSATHAEISLDDDGLVRLRDTSTNGTFVRGSKVGKGLITILEPGSDIVFGPVNADSDFRYVFQSPQSVASMRPDPYGLGDLSQDRSGVFADYEVREQLGKGSFAVVRKGIKRSNGQMVAIKIIQKARFSSNPQTMKMFEREVEIAKQLDHPFCVRCYDYYEDEQRIWLVLEYVDGGDLLDYVMKRGGLKETEVREIALMVCRAVAYLHSRGITHRDLKPENLLLTKGQHPVAKVADYGLAKCVEEGTMLKTMCGTPTYLAPEVILHNQPGMGYKSIVDAYSCGVIFYSCLTNQTPFDESEATPLPERMQHRSVDLNIPREMGISETCLDFLDQLLQNDPNSRMSCSEALNHPWLKVKDDSSVDSLPFSLGSSLPFNSGTAGGDSDMPPPARNGRPPRPPFNGDAEVATAQSTESMTSPAMSSRVRDGDEDSFVDSQGLGNLRIAQSEASMTTPETTSAPVYAAPAAPLPHPLSEATEGVSDLGLSPQFAGQKRKEMESRFSDSSLSELSASQPSQSAPVAAPVEVIEAVPATKESSSMDVNSAAHDSVAEMSGIEEEEKQAKRLEGGEDSDEREPSTTEEVDVVPTELVKVTASPRTTRRTSRGSAAGGAAKKAVTPARRGRGRASSGATSTAGETASAPSASPDPAAADEGGIAASVKSRRRKAARLN